MKNIVNKPLTNNNQQPTTILVTGANGQLGKTIEELYSKNNNNLVFTFVSKEALDITKENEVKIFFKANKFDYCINCAAYTNVEQAEKTPDIAYKVNAEGVKNLAIACKNTHTILIHISTDYVFDGEKGKPYTVDDVPSPINEYGKSKLLGEHYIQEILKNYFIIRTSWLFSKKYGKNFYKSILEKALRGEDLFVTDEQIGCPTDTVNLSSYLIDLIIIKSTTFGLLNFCDRKVMTWFDFANKIIKENKLNNKLIRKHFYSNVLRPKYSVLEMRLT